MAQTKRRRRSKHRGTAAGTIESRGRTGGKPTGGKPSGQQRRGEKPDRARERRTTRLDTPPTWRGALTRALIAAVVFFVAVVFLFHQPVPRALAPAILALAVYVPMGYYLDRFLYQRRQAGKAGGNRSQSGKRAESTKRKGRD